MKPPRYFLSFASDEGFLGAVAVEADSLDEALARVNALNINPGGEVLVLPIQAGIFPDNRLLLEAEIAAAQGGPFLQLRDLSEADRQLLEAAADFVGEQDNRSRVS